MSPGNPDDKSKPGSIETFERRWGRRTAPLIGAGGLATAGGLFCLGGGRGGWEGRNAEGMLPHREFIEQFLESRMRSPTPEIRHRQLIQEFKGSALYARIVRDTVQWFEENRHLDEVAKD